jgi:hypothetical protein
VCGDWLWVMGTYICEVVSSVCKCPCHSVAFDVVRKTCVLVGANSHETNALNHFNLKLLKNC